jgi:hypothetical protein
MIQGFNAGIAEIAEGSFTRRNGTEIKRQTDLADIDARSVSRQTALFVLCCPVPPCEGRLRVFCELDVKKFSAIPAISALY